MNKRQRNFGEGQSTPRKLSTLDDRTISANEDHIEVESEILQGQSKDEIAMEGADLQHLFADHATDAPEENSPNISLIDSSVSSDLCDKASIETDTNTASAKAVRKEKLVDGFGHLSDSELSALSVESESNISGSESVSSASDSASLVGSSSSASRNPFSQFPNFLATFDRGTSTSSKKCDDSITRSDTISNHSEDSSSGFSSQAQAPVVNLNIIDAPKVAAAPPVINSNAKTVKALELVSMASTTCLSLNFRFGLIHCKENQDRISFRGLAVDGTDDNCWVEISGPTHPFVFDKPKIAYKIRDFAWNKEHRRVTILSKTRVSVGGIIEGIIAENFAALATGLHENSVADSLQFTDIVNLWKKPDRETVNITGRVCQVGSETSGYGPRGSYTFRVMQIQDVAGNVVEVTAWNNIGRLQVWKDGAIVKVINARVNLFKGLRLNADFYTQVTAASEVEITNFGEWAKARPVGTVFRLESIDAKSMSIYPVCSKDRCSQKSLKLVDGAAHPRQYQCGECYEISEGTRATIGICIGIEATEIGMNGEEKAIECKIFRQAITALRLGNCLRWRKGLDDVDADKEEIAKEVVETFAEIMQVLFVGDYSEKTGIMNISQRLD